MSVGPESSTEGSSIAEEVGRDLLRRERFGVKKYGVDLGSAGLSAADILQHAYEEALDLASYLKTLQRAQRSRG